MSATDDMSTPVTRGELREAVEHLATRADLREAVEHLATKAELREAVEHLATKAELREAVEHLATKAELREGLEQLEQNLDQKLGLWGGALREQIAAGEQRMLSELARHAKAIQEAVSTQIAAVDDKYKGLPPRVTRLEAAVFKSKRGR